MFFCICFVLTVKLWKGWTEEVRGSTVHFFITTNADQKDIRFIRHIVVSTEPSCTKNKIKKLNSLII